MKVNRGDHICAIYSTATDMARQAAAFLADGLRRRERCWFVASDGEAELVSAELAQLGIDVAQETGRGALALIAGSNAYLVHGRFDPETTLAVFNDAIEEAHADGYTGFRAAAEMSWALQSEDGGESLIVYEALLKTLFATCRATGLCLYDQERMPLAILNGALATHPLAGTHGRYDRNPSYDATVRHIGAVDVTKDITYTLAQLRRPPAGLS